MDRSIFYAHVRASLFSGTLAQSQVDGMNAILDEWDKRKLTDVRWLAYMLGTVYHECARTMQPIKEYGGTHARYAPYFGRGFVQLTWEANYAKAGKVIGVDLVANPDLALDIHNATLILYDGMLEGWFTGKKLADYIHGTVCDYLNARRIINGTDRAQLIAGYASSFESAIRAAVMNQPVPPDVPIQPLPPPEVPSPKPAPSITAWQQLWTWVSSLFG